MDIKYFEYQAYDRHKFDNAILSKRFVRQMESRFLNAKETLGTQRILHNRYYTDTCINIFYL